MIQSRTDIREGNDNPDLVASREIDDLLGGDPGLLQAHVPPPSFSRNHE